MLAVVLIAGPHALAKDEQRASGDEYSRARFLRNAIAKESATPSWFESRSRSILRAASRSQDAVRKRRSPEVNRRRCAVALRGSSRSVMEEQVPSLKRGDWVLVDDVAVFQGRVVVVIGVTAVIRVPREDAAGDTYRAAAVRCCRPWLEETVARAGASSNRPRPGQAASAA